VQGGRLADPFFLRFAEIASQPRSAEQIFREQFEAISASTNSDIGEHLWLIARWFYSNPAKAKFSSRKNWPYRRILRLLAPARAKGRRSAKQFESAASLEPMKRRPVAVYVAILSASDEDARRTSTYRGLQPIDERILRFTQKICHARYYDCASALRKQAKVAS